MSNMENEMNKSKYWLMKSLKKIPKPYQVVKLNLDYWSEKAFIFH